MEIIEALLLIVIAIFLFLYICEIKENRERDMEIFVKTVCKTWTKDCLQTFREELGSIKHTTLQVRSAVEEPSEESSCLKGDDTTSENETEKPVREDDEVPGKDMHDLDEMASSDIERELTELVDLEPQITVIELSPPATPSSVSTPGAPDDTSTNEAPASNDETSHNEAESPPAGMDNFEGDIETDGQFVSERNTHAECQGDPPDGGTPRSMILDKTQLKLDMLSKFTEWYKQGAANYEKLQSMISELEQRMSTYIQHVNESSIPKCNVSINNAHNVQLGDHNVCKMTNSCAHPCVTHTHCAPMKTVNTDSEAWSTQPPSRMSFQIGPMTMEIRMDTLESHSNTNDATYRNDVMPD